jgi:hypothetical protein
MTKLEWLGETGLGALSFLAVPVWLIWLGVVFLEYPVLVHESVKDLILGGLI